MEERVEFTVTELSARGNRVEEAECVVIQMAVTVLLSWGVGFEVIMELSCEMCRHIPEDGDSKLL
jgi:hypothetical protein